MGRAPLRVTPSFGCRPHLGRLRLLCSVPPPTPPPCAPCVVCVVCASWRPRPRVSLCVLPVLVCVVFRVVVCVLCVCVSAWCTGAVLVLVALCLRCVCVCASAWLAGAVLVFGGAHVVVCVFVLCGRWLCCLWALCFVGGLVAVLRVCVVVHVCFGLVRRCRARGAVVRLGFLRGLPAPQIAD